MREKIGNSASASFDWPLSVLLEIEAIEKDLFSGFK